MPNPANYYLYAVDPIADFLVNRPRLNPPLGLFAPEFGVNAIWLDKMTGVGAAGSAEPENLTLVFDAGITQVVGIPLTISGTVTIDWGDGTSSTAISGQNNHTYAEPGVYTTVLTGAGSVTAIYTGTYDITRNLALIRVDSFGGQPLTRITLRGAHSLVHVPRILPATVTRFDELFKECYSFNSPMVSYWDTSNIQRFDEAFKSAYAFNRPLPWNTSSAKNMQRMLGEATSFNQSLATWATSNVTDLADFARDATAFTGMGVENFDLSSCLGMNNFALGAAVFNPDLSKWCVTAFPTAPLNFAGASLVAEHRPIWGTCPTAPSVVLSNASIAEDAAIGSVVGSLSFVNGSGSYTYTIASDPDSKFAISGSNLTTSASFDYESDIAHSVTISASNGVDSPTETAFSILITDVSDGVSPFVTGRLMEAQPTTSNLTFHTITLPPTSVGEMLLAILYYDASSLPTASVDTVYSGTGWTLVGSGMSGTLSNGISVFTKIAEASNALRVNLSSAETAGWAAWSISNATSASASFFIPPTSSADPDPPSHDAGSVAATLWIAAAAIDQTVTPRMPTSAPSGYSNLMTAPGASANGPSIAAAERISTAQAEDPGPFTQPIVEQWIAATIAVR